MACSGKRGFRKTCFIVFFILGIILFSFAIDAVPPSSCPPIPLVVGDAQEEAWALRMQEKLAERGIPVRIEQTREYGSMALRQQAAVSQAIGKRAPAGQLSNFDYDSLQVMNILSISPDAARTRGVGAVRRIGAAYKEEVGLLDVGKPTPMLSKLVDEGMLVPGELEQLRKGAPMAMGGLDRPTLEKQVIWQLRDQFILGGVNEFIHNPAGDLIIEFGENKDFPAHDIILTRERWNEFLSKHIYGTYIHRPGEASKTLLPEEFKNMELQKELLGKVSGIIARIQGKELMDKYKIAQDINVGDYRLKFVLGRNKKSNHLDDFHPISYTKIVGR